MLPVKVRFYGHVRDVVGTPVVETEVGTPGTVQALLDSLVQRFGEPFRQRMLTSQGELEASVQIFVGDNQIRSLQEPLAGAAEAQSDVKVFVLSATAGG